MKYSAFISYSHVDEKYARWLIRKLESYRVPTKLVGQQGEFGVIPKRIGKIFRDRDELASAGNLGLKVTKALCDSKALIVICSPNSAQSKWVNAEVKEFRNLQREDAIFSFIVSGNPASREISQNCFPKALLAPNNPNEAEREPLAADARPNGDGKDKAFLKLAAGLLGVGYDSLAQRHAQRRIKRLALITTASLLGMSFAIVLAVSAYIARNDALRRQAQAQDIVAYMLGDLRESLESVGRLDLMRSVDNKAIDYFSNLDARDLDDRTLEEQARSLAGIGEVSLNQGNYQDAMDAFTEAHTRSLALYERDSNNSSRLFDLSQAEFWRGYVALEQGRLNDAQLWLSKYRDSAITLSAMEPSNFDWQREVAYGYHNMAVLDKTMGNYEAALTQMLAERELYSRWLIEYPDDLQLRSEAANVDSWLGSLTLAQGKLTLSKEFFTKQVKAIEQNIEDDPNNVEWKEGSKTSLAFLAEVTEALGNFTQSKHLYQRAFAIAEQLYNQDPSNAIWMLELGQSHWRLAKYESEKTDFHLMEAYKLIWQAFQLNPKDERSAYLLAEVKIFQSHDFLSRGIEENASQLTAEIEQILSTFWSENSSEELRLTFARNLILKGLIHYENEQFDDAEALWLNALAMLETPTSNSVPFKRVPDIVRVLLLLGRTQKASEYQQLLSDANYVRFKVSVTE